MLLLLHSLTLLNDRMLLSAIVYFVMNDFFVCLYFRFMNIIWETVEVVTVNKYNETGSVTEK